MAIDFVKSRVSRPLLPFQAILNELCCIRCLLVEVIFLPLNFRASPGFLWSIKQYLALGSVKWMSVSPFLISLYSFRVRVSFSLKIASFRSNCSPSSKYCIFSRKYFTCISVSFTFYFRMSLVPTRSVSVQIERVHLSSLGLVKTLNHGSKKLDQLLFSFANRLIADLIQPRPTGWVNGGSDHPQLVIIGSPFDDDIACCCPK